MAKNNFTDYAGYCDYYTSNDFIAHFGILGMKWGVRRYQNPDGTLTSAGRLRYKQNPNTGEYEKRSKNMQKYLKNATEEVRNRTYAWEDKEREWAKDADKAASYPASKRLIDQGFVRDGEDLIKTLLQEKAPSQNKLGTYTTKDHSIRVSLYKKTESDMNIAEKTVNDVMKNRKEIQDACLNAAIDDMVSLYTANKNDYPDMFGKNIHNEKDLAKSIRDNCQDYLCIRIDNINNIPYCNLSFGAQGNMANSPIGDHTLDVEYDLNKRKPTYVSMNG